MHGENFGDQKKGGGGGVIKKKLRRGKGERVIKRIYRVLNMIWCLLLEIQKTDVCFGFWNFDTIGFQLITLWIRTLEINPINVFD